MIARANQQYIVTSKLYVISCDWSQTSHGTEPITAALYHVIAVVNQISVFLNGYMNAARESKKVLLLQLSAHPQSNTVSLW